MLQRAHRLGLALAHAGFGQLLIRGILGVVFLFHGSQKLFGLFGGGGINGTAGFFESLGLPLPTVSALMAGGTEFFGGALLILGLLTRPAAVGLAFTMAVAIWTAHRDAFAASAGGMEYALTLGVVALGLALLGPGPISADRIVFRKLTR